MSKYDFPEDVTEIEADMRIYTEDEVDLIIEAPEFSEEEVSLNMHLESHERFSDIVPDDSERCDHEISDEEVSDVSDLPEEYESLFMGAVDELRDRGFEVRDQVGICLGCMDFSNPDGVLLFTSFFE